MLAYCNYEKEYIQIFKELIQVTIIKNSCYPIQIQAKLFILQLIII